MLDKWLRENARLIIACLGLLAVVLACLFLFDCSRDRDVAEQARQTNRSGEAIQAAASEAVAVIGNRVATERNIDAAVGQATDKIAGATDAEAVRDEVLKAVCAQRSHRNDPSCIASQ